MEAKTHSKDYYTFGMLMPGRFYNSPDYKYGFNGKMKDDEVKGNGNSYNFDDRLYDPRVGRWLSIDPLQREYPSLSHYGYAANSPLMFMDEDGKVIVDPKTKLPVVKVDGQWKTITGTDANNKPTSYGEVSKEFQKV